MQMLLRKHYLVANIGDQYMRLDWKDYRGDDSVRDTVANYIDNWPSFKINGMGFEFNSKNLGTGKTFGATYIGKELIKRGERVFFIPFLEVISTFTREHQEAEQSMRESTVLILDEVVPPVSEAQGALFASKLEEIIRYRTNYNLVNIMTTNLSEDELHRYYPRTYSLLEAKQVRIPLEGIDARQDWIGTDNLELAMNNEVRPIT
jgi:hypothetical protein